MKKLPGQILNEVLWLILSLALAVCLVLVLFDGAFSQETVNLHLYDTMFVISRWHILLPVFFLVAFIISIIKESRKSFRRALPNTVLTAVGLTLAILLAVLSQSFSQVTSGGGTVYPPLSALSTDEVFKLTENTAARFLASFLTAAQIIVVLILLFIAYQWGKNGRSPGTKGM